MRIICAYEKEPNFPATDQHPDATRSAISGHIIDAIGKPTDADVQEFLGLGREYMRLRAAEYPSFADQADMQYWDKVNGTNNWQTAIGAIKTKYPKE